MIIGLDYTAKEEVSILNALKVFGQQKFSDKWTDFNDSNLATMTLRLVSYVGGLLMYNLDREANECFLTTARLRKSVVDKSKEYNYQLSTAQPPTCDDQRIYIDPTVFDYGTPLPKGFRVSNGSDIYAESVQAEVIAAGSTFHDFSVVEGKTINETYAELGVVGYSTGKADQRFKLSYKPVIIPKLEGSGDAPVVYVGGSSTPWTPKTTLVYSGENSQHYVLETNELDETFVVFGDGSYGTIPPLGAKIEVVYRIGGGARGRVNADVMTEVETARAGVTATTNLTAFSGGADKETIAQAKKNIPASLKSMVCCSLTDHSFYATQVDGVAKAFSVRGNEATHIWVYIAPDGGGAPTEVLKQAVYTSLITKTMGATSLYVYDPIYQNVKVKLKAVVSDQYRSSDVQESLKENILSLFDFDSVEFGTPARVKDTEDKSDLNDVIEATEGLKYVDTLIFTKKPQVLPERINNTGTVELARVSDGFVFSPTTPEVDWFIEITGVASDQVMNYKVYKREFGASTTLNDSSISDAEKDWTVETGTSTLTGLSKLQDSTKFWKTDEFAGYKLVDSNNATFSIVSNDSNVLTLSTPSTPTAGTYRIIKDFDGWYLNPNVSQESKLLVTGNTQNTVSVSSGIGDLGRVGDAYFLEKEQVAQGRTGIVAKATTGSVASVLKCAQYIDGSGFAGFHADGYFNEAVITFRSGALEGQSRSIQSFDSDDGSGLAIISVYDPFTEDPAPEDEFEIGFVYTDDEESFKFTLIGDNSLGAGDIFRISTSELVGDIKPKVNEILQLDESDLELIMVGGVS